MKYDIIKPYIEKGLVSEQAHPEKPSLRIFNYTQECQFSRAWDEVTRQCRGLIMDIETGEIIARPFEKFFNYGEHVANGWEIPDETPIVTEKLDGSLGILYEINGEPWVATRGSFTSDQALWATDWYRKNVGHTPPKDATVLFEIIYPANRIVVQYDFSGLVFLAAIDTQKGLPIAGWESMFGGRYAKQIPYTDLEALAAMDEPNSEGFVLFYPTANKRMKIKFPEYVRLHKLVTGVNEIAIWEHLRDGKTLGDLIEKVPDEFYQWVTQTSNRLNDAFNAIRDQAETDYNSVMAEVPVDENNQRNRKEVALKFQEKKNPGILFAMFDNKPTGPLIWRMVRPSGAKVFAKDLDV